MEKILFITGASSDIGMALLKRIGKDYSHIFLQYRVMNPTLEALLAKPAIAQKILPLQADFADENSVKNIIEKVQESSCWPTHIVHFPAPRAYNCKFSKDSWENFQTGWDISVRSITEILQCFLKPMAKNHFGRIIFMLSDVTQNIPPKYQVSYVTVKYALLGLMKALSAEYSDRGITVNGVSPAMMRTKFVSEVPDLLIEQYTANLPLGRTVLPEEILPVFEYLLSDASAAMTGQNIGITGGE